MKNLLLFILLITGLSAAATPTAVIRANGLTSLTIKLPCYTQKDNGSDAITLNGRYSTNALYYLFTKTSGPSCVIMNATDGDTRVTKLVQGTYVFNLLVTDNVGATANASVTVTVNAADAPATITVDTLGTYGTTAGGDLNYIGNSNKICYIRAGIYRTLYLNADYNILFKAIGGQVRILSNAYYCVRGSDAPCVNITFDGSGIAGQTYGFYFYGPNVSDAVIRRDDSSRNWVIHHCEIVSGYSLSSGGEGAGMQVYPSAVFDTTSSGLTHTRQNGYTMGNDSIYNNYIHGAYTEGLYGGPSHYGDKTVHSYTGYFTEAQVDTGYYANNIIDTCGQAGFDCGAAWYATVKGNKFWHFGLRNVSGHMGGINWNGGSNAWIEGNDFWCNTAYTILTQGIACQGVGGWVINNTFTGCERALILLRNTDTACSRHLPDLYIYNNTAANCNYGWDAYSSNYLASSIHLKNNIFAGMGTNFTTSTGGYTAIDSSNNIYGSLASMKFTDTTARNYNITSLSPAISGGLNLSALFTKDYNGTTRSTWGLGAFYYAAASPYLQIIHRRRK